MPQKVYLGRIHGAKGDRGEKGDPGPKGETGDQGPRGLQGVPGDPAVIDPAELQAQLAQLSVAYTHVQSVPSDTWTITHPLPYSPSVTVVDSAGTEVEGSVQYLNQSTVQVRFSAGFSGKAYLS